MASSHKKTISYNDLSMQRAPVMGLATLFILIFHLWDYSCIYSANWQFFNFFQFFFDLGDVGVDIFLIASGFGAYYSLKKNSIITFYKNRIIRLYPEYTLIVIVYTCILRQFSEFFKYIFHTNWLLHNDMQFWYISFIIVIYLITPVLIKIVKGIKSGLSIVLAVVAINSVLFLYLPVSRDLAYALNRIPSYILGIIFAQLAEKNAVAYVKEKVLYLIIELMAVFTLLVTYLKNLEFWNLSIMYPLIAVIVTFIFIYLVIKDKSNVLSKIFSSLGKNSLAIYLCGNLIIPRIVRRTPIPLFAEWIVSTIVVLLAGYLLSFICNKVREKSKNKPCIK